jgi:hypothetical protein
MSFQQIEFLNMANANSAGTVQCCLTSENGHFSIRENGQTLLIEFPLLEVDITRSNAIKKLKSIASVAANGADFLEKLPPALEQKSTNS